MSSTYSSNLRIELIGSGDQAGTWGTTTNGNLAYVLDTAIAGFQEVTVSSTNQALTYVNGPSSTASLNQSVYAMLKFNGATAASNIFAPPASKQYTIWNNTSYALTIYNSTVIGNTTYAPGAAGVTINAGNKVIVWSNGTSFYEVQAQNLTGTLAIANGGTGQTTQQAAMNALAGTQTANRVLRSDGTNTTLSQVNVGTDVTGTLAIANGGTGVTTLAALGNLFYPVGSIYSSTVSTNPGTLLGFGTWAQFGAGQMLMGAGGAYAAGSTGGSANATLVSHTHTFSATTGAMNSNASHYHNIQNANQGNWGSLNYPSFNRAASIQNSVVTDPANIDHTHSVSGTTDTSGSSGTNANLPPYIVVYMWQRTA